MNKPFARLAEAMATAAGHWAAFVLAVGFVLVWLAVGIVAGFSDEHRGKADTMMAIVTFLLLFVVQATQVRNERGIQVKLDAISAALPDVDDAVVGIERPEREDER